MISHKHKFIFIHIPKTGGSSVESFFTGGYTEGGLNSKHRMAKSYEAKFPNKFLKYFKFSVVRNPWEKCFSHYNYRVHDTLQSGFEKAMANFSFAAWLLEKRNSKLVFGNQVDFLSDASGKVCMDYLIRFENLQEDFNIVCDKIGIPRQKLPHINKTKHKHYTEYYDDETRQIVAERYAKDIERFGYKFGE